MEVEEKYKPSAEVETKQIDGQIQKPDFKLNRLLDGYFDQVIEPEVYKQKRNELLGGRMKLEEDKSQIYKSVIV